MLRVSDVAKLIEIPVSSSEESNTVLISKCPVILKDVSHEWPAARNWSHEWLKDTRGKCRVPVSVGPRIGRKIEWMPLEEAISLMEAGSEEIYLRQISVPGSIPGLENDFILPDFCPKDRLILVHIWIGPKGSIQPFHKDNHNPLAVIEGLLVQIRGSKEVMLVGPEYDNCMYKRSGDTDYHYSRIDADNIDLNLFPKISQAVVHGATIHEGDAIYIPGDTWHYVRSLSKSISLSFWWFRDYIAEAIFKITTFCSGRSFDSLQLNTIHESDVQAFGGYARFNMAINILPLKERSVLASFCDPAIRTHIQP
jgi:lysine-specific demethylase 8